ncbi:MAG: hypothetical protein PSV35_01435 [bacterium]|nr:hypothetical protein [bacterium]
MLRKIGFSLLCAAATLTTNAYCMSNHALQAGITIEYELPAGEPQLFSNFLFWSVEADCKLFTEDESNLLVIEAKAKSGKINGMPVSKGDMISLLIHGGDVLRLQADGGAKVEITNTGEHLVKASCSS